MKIKIYTILYFLLFLPPSFLFSLTEQEEYECRLFYLLCINGHYSQISNQLLQNPPVKNKMLLSYKHPETNESAFMAVLSKNLPLIARLLFMAGATHTHEQNAAGFSPIHIAAMNGQNEIIYLLLLNKVPIDIQTVGSEQTALHLATLHNQGTTVKLLLACGARHDVCDSYKRLPLHYAIMNGNQELTRVFLKNKQFINAQDFDGKAPIYFAIEASSDYFKWFLKTYKKYINFSIQDTSGNTPLHWAIYHEDVRAVVYLLLLNSPLSLSNHRALTPLELAKDLDIQNIIEAIELRISCK